MIFGYDSSPEGKVCCLAKQWESGCTAAILLSATGTGMAQDAVCNGIASAFEFAQASLQLCMEEIQSGSGAEDLVYAATKVADACLLIHRRVLDISQFAGQGIYLSGAVLYITSTHYFMLPFGGASVYSLAEAALIPLGNAVTAELARDAIGGSTAWTPRFWKGSRESVSRLILTSAPVPKLSDASARLAEIDANAHPCTAAILLRKALNEKYPHAPAGVIDIQF